ncbi:MAG: tRNA glutamyl-Q(34) synthetase GluQRS, partial [Amylibacter sp.]
MNDIVTRFAPSPSGRLHLGHAFSALKAYGLSAVQGGQFLLRIEDIDQGRCRPEYIDAIKQDLQWLGIKWPEPVRIQSQHFNDYKKALDKLQAFGVIYPCFCTRRQITTAQEADPLSAPHGPDGARYPGTCLHLTPQEVEDQMNAGASFALRLNVTKALDHVEHPLIWTEEGPKSPGETQARPELLGDVVLARKDTPTSYHLAVCVDDAIQGVNLVVRGQDLFHATHIHCLIQDLLGLPRPRYFHHELITDSKGLRLATRSNANTLDNLRA